MAIMSSLCSSENVGTFGNCFLATFGGECFFCFFVVCMFFFPGGF